MAPAPPAFDPSAPYEPAQPTRLMAFTGQPIPFPSHIPLSDPGLTQPGGTTYAQRTALKAEGESGKGCRIQDRFDRGAVVAYQWGDNRISLDVDGLSLSSQEIEAVKFEYKLKLQPQKTRKEKCRYESAWQGMAGSGYNELFKRKENTIWNQLEKIGDDAEDALDKLF